MEARHNGTTKAPSGLHLPPPNRAAHSYSGGAPEEYSSTGVIGRLKAFSASSAVEGASAEVRRTAATSGDKGEGWDGEEGREAARGTRSAPPVASSTRQLGYNRSMTS
jgi:hypothetical protein